jgi:branched-chain amino acid transport system ATP-binding protein
VSAAPEISTRVALTIEGLSVPRAGRPVLREVSLEIAPGEVTALLGPNGTGKSTLVLAVAGALRPTSGRVLLGDQDLTRRRPEAIRRAGVAVVPEGRRLLPELTVADNLRVATYTLPRDEADIGTDYVLDLFPELRPRLHVIGRSLSGGQQQMVVLAQALASRPSVLLVDELSLGLAPLVVKRLVPTLAAVADSGVGVLLIEQFAHVALGLANSAYILGGGRIRYRGSARELKANPDLLHSAYLLRV